jgi:hypothetical protein
MVYFVDVLDEKSLSEIQTIFKYKLEDKSYESNLMEKWKLSKSLYTRFSLTKKSESSNIIISIAKKFFEKADLKFNENNGYIDYQSYIFNYPKYNKEDYDYLYSPNQEYEDVNECVFILKKDKNINGGNLEIYNEDPNTISRIFGFENEPVNKEIIPLETGMVFVCDGSTILQFLNCGGHGQYDIVRIIGYTYNRSGYRYDNDNDNE